MRYFLRELRKKRFNYKPLIEVFIHKETLLNNLKQFQSIDQNYQVAPVLKSNAYGHGLTQVAQTLDSENIPFLVVDSYYEVVILRNEKIKSKLLIIGYTYKENIYKNNLEDVSFTIGSLNELKDISKNLKSKRKFHIKIDTGMHRNGILFKDINKAIRHIKENPNIIIEGICSHLADADGDARELTVKQIENWNLITDIWYKNFPKTKFYHLSATAGVRFSNEINANVMRVGLGLYGFETKKNRNINLSPILEMNSIVSSVKEIKKGSKIGYNFTYEAKKDMKIATIPVGYYEGIDRRLSNKGFVKIKEDFCPIVGRVSMNIITVDVSHIKRIKEGDKVIIISKEEKDKNSVKNISKYCDTIPYVILVHIPEKLRRIIV